MFDGVVGSPSQCVLCVGVRDGLSSKSISSVSHQSQLLGTLQQLYV